MEDLSEIGFDPVPFNNELFVNKGVPLKFYVHGSDEQKSLSLTHIVEAYGGKSTNPDGPGTFIFCDPNCPLDAGGSDCYDVQYFHDSINQLQPQELKDYKLNPPSNKRPWRFTNDQESSHLEKNEENNDAPKKLCKYKLIVSVDRLPEGSVKGPKLKKSHCKEENNNHDKENDIDGTSRDDYGKEKTGSLSTAGKSGVDPGKLKHFVDVEHPNECGSRDMSEGEQSHHQDDDNIEDEEDTRRSFSEDDEDSEESEVGHSNDDHEGDKSENSSEKGENFDAEESSQSTDDTDSTRDRSNYASSASIDLTSSEAKGKKNGRRIVFTEEEDEKIVAWLLEKNVIPNDFAIRIWEDMLEEKVLENCSASPGVLSSHYRKDIKSNPTFEKFIIENDFHISQDREILTEEGNLKIIEWIMQKNVIPPYWTIRIWQDMLDEEVLPNCNISPETLSRYYREQLKDHPIFKEYVKNSHAQYMSRHHFTEEEDRIIMNHLINNDVINDTTNPFKSGKVWLDCFIDNKSSLHPTRTDQSLRSRFRNHLRYNYEKFTDDPDVLKKFRELEKKG